MSNSELGCVNINQDHDATSTSSTVKDFEDFASSSLESQVNVHEKEDQSSFELKKEDDGDDDQEKQFISSGRLSNDHDDDDNDNDGFRTPTSTDHKIPVMAQCPPAPTLKKIMPSRKRKVASSSSSIISPVKLLEDLSEEVDSMFARAIQQDFRKKMKKDYKDEDNHVAPT